MPITREIEFKLKFQIGGVKKIKRRLRMMFQEIAPGIQLIGRFGIVETGIWILYHGKEAILLEMPGLLVRKGRIPFKEIRTFLTENGLRLKFLTATHNHVDHFASVRFFHDNLPESPILVHKSFFHDKPVSVIYNEDQINQGRLETPSIRQAHHHRRH
jgi:glyoxylase-like metal-dependent hydrolase (beta-lactamase superfamily II)